MLQHERFLEQEFLNPIPCSITGMTENPCVGGSIPSLGTTSTDRHTIILNS